MGPYRRASLVLLLVVAGACTLASCGGGEAGEGGEAPSAGALIHVDGTVEVHGDAFDVTPKQGDVVTFTYGSKVDRAGVRAFAASGAPARVSYRLGEDDPVAVSVRAAPALGEGLQSYVGTIASVSDEEIVIDGSDGERAFTIGAADREAFDVPHLRQHQDDSTPVRVYFDPDEPTAGIAYEDA